MSLPLRIYLSEFDPENSAEGNIDPLGLYPIADYLALQLAPGIRERQKHPRFLTSIVVGLSLFDDVSRMISEEQHKVERWQVFEWLVVSGLVKTARENNSIFGLPGVEKARHALAHDLPLCPERYLKTPGVFGFHGIYKLLARTVAFERAEELGESGYELLETWANEQGLKGFCGSAEGPGKKLRFVLARSIAESLKAGHVTEPWRWSNWSFFDQHLHHLKPGKAEAQFIMTSLLRDDGGLRTQVFDFLKSNEGTRIWNSSDDVSERRIHAVMKNIATPKLKSLIEAIDVYESFARLMTDAFNDGREFMTRSRNVVTAADISSLSGVKLAAERVPILYREIRSTLEPWNQAARFDSTFHKFEFKMEPKDFAECLLRHHMEIQERKPPNGKNPWFLYDESGQFRLRPGYYTEEGGKHNEEYVHAYRSRSIWGFLSDLGVVQNG